MCPISHFAALTPAGARQGVFSPIRAIPAPQTIGRRPGPSSPRPRFRYPIIRAVETGEGGVVKKRAWLLYPCLAALATAIYYVTGHDSYLFNLIGLSSPLLILAA